MGQTCYTRYVCDTRAICMQQRCDTDTISMGCRPVVYVYTYTYMCNIDAEYARCVRYRCDTQTTCMMYIYGMDATYMQHGCCL